MAEVYLSTDIESDGPIPGPHSMLSFASVAIDERGVTLGTFERNLETLPDAAGHPDTMAWWATQPVAWAECRRDPVAPAAAMNDYVSWVAALPGKPVFVAYPAGFDFTFVYWYLVKFTGKSPFAHRALDIRSYAMAAMKTSFLGAGQERMPKEWLGTHPHTHRALDDAIGQGQLFVNLLAAVRGR